MIIVSVEGVGKHPKPRLVAVHQQPPAVELELCEQIVLQQRLRVEVEERLYGCVGLFSGKTGPLRLRRDRAGALTARQTRGRVISSFCGRDGAICRSKRPSA